MNRKRKEEFISVKINQISFEHKKELLREIYIRAPSSADDGSTGGIRSIFFETDDLKDEDIDYLYDKISDILKNINP